MVNIENVGVWAIFSSGWVIVTIMEDDKVFLFVPPDVFALDQEGATLRHEGNKIRAIHGARADDCWPSGGGGVGLLLPC